MVLPQRKHPRLKEYDYSQDGYYYVTVHIAQNASRLASVVAGPETGNVQINLTAAGQIAKNQLLDLEKRFPYVRIDKYVVMPTHIHVIIQFFGQTAGASPRPTLPHVIGVYKSLTTRACNKISHTPGKKLFQASFYESVLRNETDYRARWKYIDENPIKWTLDPEDL